MWSSKSDFEKLCSLEVLGLSNEGINIKEFREDLSDQLTQKEDGHYITRLSWKHEHPLLPSNKDLAVARLLSTIKRLERIGKLTEYYKVFQDHLKEGIIEEVPAKPTGEVIHYIPHQAVIWENAQCTKLRIVCDCSAKPNAQVPSLNNCLEMGPAVQPQLFDIILRNHLKVHNITGNIKKAFLQIWIQEEDREVQRVLWYEDLQVRNVVAYRLTRVIFGAGPSPYFLGATMHKHVSRYKDSNPGTAKALLEVKYVDDIQYRGESAEELIKFKEESIAIMKGGGFTMHKWHSSIASVENDAAEHKVKRQFWGHKKSIIKS